VAWNLTCTLATPGGDSPYCVLDKVVPGYYHRRTELGDICGSCCCNNTASEHAMAERLIVDDLVHWARTYKARTPQLRKEIRPVR
jgi:pullulanase/glycogen debranching enzyme